MLFMQNLESTVNTAPAAKLQNSLLQAYIITEADTTTDACVSSAPEYPDSITTDFQTCRSLQCDLSGECLNKSQICDGVPDCPRGEDEHGCGGKTWRCAPKYHIFHILVSNKYLTIRYSYCNHFSVRLKPPYPL